MISEPGTAGIRTFLIADVRGYTRFTEEHGDHAAGTLARRFSEIARDVVEASGGTVVEFRGDEALAAFDSARAAIGAAVELQRRLADATFADESLPLPAGVGLDAGEAVPVEGGYRGGALNLAARLCGMAGPGEILASQEVVHLAGRITGVTYEQRGSLQVKNLSQPVRVVRVVPASDDPVKRFALLGVTAMEAAKPRKLRVGIAEDSVLVREVLVRVLTDADCEIVGQSQDAEGLMAAVRQDQPDVVVTDIRMPPTHTNEGLMAALAIRAEFPQVAVLVLSQYVETHHAMDLLAANPGGVGYLLKDRLTDVSELGDAVRRVAAGGTVVDPEVIGKLLRRRRDRDQISALTDRERTILAMMAEGHSDGAICDRLSLPHNAVADHITEIFTKLGLEADAGDHRRVLAVLAYLRA
jgi:DNA-binding NarL/FixJ family response regulator/class 3 adenylate cyclase